MIGHSVVGFVHATLYSINQIQCNVNIHRLLFMINGDEVTNNRQYNLHEILITILFLCKCMFTFLYKYVES
ncbi:hypothetical protein V1478_003784 [Vespula squamosa]|uniref:Uncharacterized protein n=1 Tax=Vespula squamosa TaxID=30214 RepID=A0ABD2BMT6_VESSQ